MRVGKSLLLEHVEQEVQELRASCQRKKRNKQKLVKGGGGRERGEWDRRSQSQG